MVAQEERLMLTFVSDRTQGHILQYQQYETDECIDIEKDYKIKTMVSNHKQITHQPRQERSFCLKTDVYFHVFIASGPRIEAIPRVQLSGQHTS